MNFKFEYFQFILISFGIAPIDTFIHSRISLEKHTRFQTKMGKMYTRFQTKTAKKYRYILRGGTYLYGLYKGVPPPGHLQFRNFTSECFLASMTYHSVFVYYATHILYTSTFKVKLLIL